MFIRVRSCGANVWDRKAGRREGRIAWIAKPVTVIGIKDILIAFDQWPAFKRLRIRDGCPRRQPVVHCLAAIEDHETLGQVEVSELGERFQASLPLPDRIIAERPTLELSM